MPVSTWRPPPTLDDHMYEVQTNIWWDNRDRAKRRLIWLMDTFLGDSYAKEAAISEIPSRAEEEGEDGYEYYVVGHKGAD